MGQHADACYYTMIGIHQPISHNHSLRAPISHDKNNQIMQPLWYLWTTIQRHRHPSHSDLSAAMPLVSTLPATFRSFSHILIFHRFASTSGLVGIGSSTAWPLAHLLVEQATRFITQ